MLKSVVVYCVLLGRIFLVFHSFSENVRITVFVSRSQIEVSNSNGYNVFQCILFNFILLSDENCMCAKRTT